jgi:predicted TIM-barrel fold metal-dependent hydrolase
VIALPRLISVDDHVLEPPDIWTSRLPSKLRDQGPHVRREKGIIGDTLRGLDGWVAGGDHGRWADVWYYDDLRQPLVRGFAQCGFRDEETSRVITYEEAVPGAWQRDARLAVLDENHTDASMCFPNVCRFCGQIFLQRNDKEVALLCVQAYNDWMIDEWCGSERPARLIPLTLLPLWDADLAAAEVRRCAGRGAHAVSFPEMPPGLGLPSIYTNHWDPFFVACEETDTVINMHVGSSSTHVMSTSDGPVSDLMMHFLFVNSTLAFTDWLYSGVLQEFPKLRIVLSEGQVGWMPFVMQRLDNTWRKTQMNRNEGVRRAKELPSSVVPGRVYGCIFDDLQGLIGRNAVGIEQILIETDFPHTDSTYPHSEKVISELVTTAGLDDREISLVARGNAIEAYQLDRYFGIAS